MYICTVIHSLQNAFTYISSVQFYNSWSGNNRFSLYMMSFLEAFIQLSDVLRAFWLRGMCWGAELSRLFLLGGAVSCGENREWTIKTHVNPLTEIHSVLEEHM